MSKTKLALTFRIFQNGQFLREDTLTLGVIKIGKVPSAHLRIDDDSVSRMHAVLEVNPHDVSLIDLGSTRGTFVNGKKINKAKLQSGDVIQLGDVRVELAISQPALASGTASSAALAPVVPAAPPAASGVVSSAAMASTSGTIAAPRTAPAPALALHSVLVSDPALAPPPVPPARPPVPVLRSVPSSTPPPPIAHPRATTTPGALALGLPIEAAPRLAAPPRAAETTDELGGARAIEVAAMFGDSVIDVKHCMDPRGGKITPATWGWFATGVVCLLISAIAFATAVQTSADDAARRDTWTRIQHRPAYAFRPTVLNPGIDWLAAGGFVFGLAGVARGLWRMRGERRSPFYRIGTAPGVELAVEHAPQPAFPLIAPSGDDFVFNYGAGIDGELIVDGKATPLAELAAAGRSRPSASTAGAIEVPIPLKARIRARIGQTTFMVSAVARPRRHAAPLFAHLESRALSYFTGSLAVHLAIWALLRLVPDDQTTASIAFDPDEQTGMKYVGIAKLETPPEEIKDHGDSPSNGATQAAPAMALPAGASGDPSVHSQGRIQIAERDSRPPMTRQEAIEEARTAGPLGSVALLDGVRVLGATGDYENGFDGIDRNGSIYGPDSAGGGMFGGGLHGPGGGGGCLGGSCGTIAAGPYGRIGVDPRGLAFGLPNRDGIGMPGHQPAVPHVGQAVISGSSYDKSIVRRYIRRHLNEISYCYEKQLLAHPTIGGEVKLSFFISPNGSVPSSSGEGFDPEVTSCLASVIKSIEFPPPGDGGGVQVNYPFHFHAPGA
ncbi:MAG TPA: AgmX/PglI C-terminal domain-containing protein [Kofleriaceae bacterium]|nr:AgmX/PglI C-terminal domain-containing protein [Kofleriaceae bacterium]